MICLPHNVLESNVVGQKVILQARALARKSKRPEASEFCDGLYTVGSTSIR